MKPEPFAWAYQNANTEHQYLVWHKQDGGRNWMPLFTQTDVQEAILAERQRIVNLLMIQHEAANKDEELLRQAFDAIVNVLAGADYDDPYASLREAAKALSDRLGGGLK